MLSSESFPALGCSNTVVVPDPAALPEAVALARQALDEVDSACSRFRPDSELSRINAAGGGDFTLSPLLEAAIEAGLRTAAMTGGLVDLTIGARMRELGYTVTFRDLPADGPPLRLRALRELDWTDLGHDPETHSLRVPAGTLLDLGASGKAWAADFTAAAAGAALGLPVMVSCGGDVAVGGPPLEGGWPVRVELEPGSAQRQDVHVFDGGLATSGPAARRWRRGDRELHHIVDPRTGQPAETPWSMVTVAGASCVDANAAATAAVILGLEALPWLEQRGLPGRLVDLSGRVHVTGGWQD